MRVISFLIVFLIFVQSAFSQAAIPQAMRAQFTLEGLGDGLSKGDLLYGVPLPAGRVLGDSYLQESWNPAKILIYGNDKIIEGFAVKYDIKAQILEIKARNGIKILEAHRIKTLVWLDSATNQQQFFVNAKEYTEDGAPLSGLLEVISDGSIPLLKRTLILEKDPTYVPAFNAGSRDTKLMKKDKFYFSKNRMLTKIGSRKSLLPAFGDRSNEMEEFMKSKKLSMGEDDLAQIFEFYNSKFQPATN